MNYEEYRSTSKWTKGFWDPELSALSKPPLFPEGEDFSGPNNIYGYEIYNNYILNPSRTYEFDFFEYDKKIINPYWKGKTVKYTLNAHGYRGPSFNSDAKLKIVTIGCSHAFGLGIDDSSTWAEQLKKLISAQFNTNDVEVFNLGTPGASSDLNTVQLYQLIDIIKPNIVLWVPPAWRRYDIGINSLLSINSEFIDLFENVIEHGTYTLVPGEEFLAIYNRAVIDYANTGSLDIQTRYQNFCKNFSIVRDLCEYNNIIFYSFANFQQFNGLFTELCKAYTCSSGIRNLMYYLKFINTREYVLDKDNRSFINVIAQEEAMMDYLVIKTQKNVIGYDSRNLKKAMVKIYKGITSGLYDDYFEGVDSNCKLPNMHLKLLARDSAHNGDFFSFVLANVSYSVIEKDVAKLLNTL